MENNAEKLLDFYIKIYYHYIITLFYRHRFGVCIMEGSIWKRKLFL